VLAFRRGPDDGADGTGLTCLVNLSAAAVPLPAHSGVLLASGPLEDGAAPPDTAVWLGPT
jgi:alpha-glucosidase